MRPTAKSITAAILATVTVLVTWPTTLVGSGNCFDVVTHPSESTKCICRSNATGTDGSCDARTYQKDAHDLCMPANAGFWNCQNNWKDIGWNANCTTEVNWTQWSYCYLLGGALCVATCTLRPTSSGCFSCIAAMGKGCFACSIRYCQEGERTPLFCNKIAPGYPTGPGCPGTKP